MAKVWRRVFEYVEIRVQVDVLLYRGKRRDVRAVPFSFRKQLRNGNATVTALPFKVPLRKRRLLILLIPLTPRPNRFTGDFEQSATELDRSH